MTPKINQERRANRKHKTITMISSKGGIKNTLKRWKMWKLMRIKYQGNCRMETWLENWVWN